MKNRLIKAISAAVAAAVVSASSVVSFAASEPAFNKTLADYTDSTNWKATYTASQTSRSYVDFSKIDASDEEHGEVLKYYYLKGTTMGGVIRLPAAYASTRPNRLLSLDFYVYDNTIPYEIRFMGYETESSSTGGNIGQINVNYGNFSSGEVNTNAKIGVMDAGQTTGAEKATVEVTNKQWHKLNAFFTEKEVKFYIDGTYLGTSIVPQTTIENNYNYFSAVQMVSRENYQASSVTADSGLYIDNLKLYLYEEDAAFYGTAAASKNEIRVNFSESILSTSAKNFGSIAVYNTKTRQQIKTGTSVLLNSETLIIPLLEEIPEYVEFLIKMPDNLTGVSGKGIFGDVYFTYVGDGTLEYMNEGFSNYTTIPSENTTDVLSPGPQWFGNGYINTKASGDTAHGNILYAGNVAGNKGNNPLRFGIKLGNDDVIDVTEGEASVEFDMKIVNPNYSLLYIMPYSTIDGVDDATLTNSAVNNNQPTNPSHFCGLSVANGSQISKASSETGGKAWVQMRIQDSQVVGAQNYDTLKVHGGYKYSLVPVGEWFKMKITIDKSSGVPMIKVYTDGSLLYASTSSQNFSGASATDFLRGIRFTMYVPTEANAVTEDYIHIDNVVFKGAYNPSRVTKIRMCGLNGEAFGPMSDNVKASTQSAEIYFSNAVDTSSALVYLEGGSENITCTLKGYDDVNNRLSISFNGVMEKNTDYTLHITGVKTTGGKAAEDSSAAFTTDGTGEFIIDNLTITDAYGNVIDEVSDVAAGDTVYPRVQIINTLDEDKTALVVGTVFNDLAMVNTRAKLYDIPSGSKITVTDEIPMKVENVEELSLYSMIWESFESNRPVTDSYTVSR